MVKVSELWGQAPEENGGRSPSLRAFRELIVPDVPDISSHRCGMRLALDGGVEVIKKTKELFLAKRSWDVWGGQYRIR